MRTTRMRGIATAWMAAALATCCVWPAVSEACVPAAGDQRAAQKRDMRDVTSVYEARIENVIVRDPYGESIDFTVRPTAAIWGPVSPEPVRLSLEAGACNNWLFLMEDNTGNPPPNGLKVIVLSSPQALADGHWLYILRADASYLDSFLADWRAARTVPTLQGHP